MAINYRQGIFRIKIVVSVLLFVSILVWVLDDTNGSNYWMKVALGTAVCTVISIAGLWGGCWLIEKIARWIIRGFKQTEAKETE